MSDTMTERINFKRWKVIVSLCWNNVSRCSVRPVSKVVPRSWVGAWRTVPRHSIGPVLPLGTATALFERLPAPRSCDRRCACLWYRPCRRRQLSVSYRCSGVGIHNRKKTETHGSYRWTGSSVFTLSKLFAAVKIFFQIEQQIKNIFLIW